MVRVVKVFEKGGVGKENTIINQYFPYKTWRRFQKEIAEVVYNALKNKEHVVLEAPTGLGKTASVLSAVLPIMFENELKVIWCCRTHQQIITVLNEISKIKQKSIFPIGLWGRRQLCSNNEVNNLSENVFRHACSILKKSFKCPFFRPEDSQWIIENLKNITYPNEAKKRFLYYQLCP
jgi:DNA excision repair protein ERCC-2